MKTTYQKLLDDYETWRDKKIIIIRFISLILAIILLFTVITHNIKSPRNQIILTMIIFFLFCYLGKKIMHYIYLKEINRFEEDIQSACDQLLREDLP